MAESTRLQQLRMIQDDERTLFVVTELDEVEARLASRLDGLNSKIGANQAEVLALIRSEAAAIRHEAKARADEDRAEMRDRDDKTNKRITTMQGMLIGALSSTTVAMVIGFLNLVAS